MTSSNQKEVLTTGDVARLCHVAPRTVSKWFDTGKLRGYRIPGSRDRRIPTGHLRAFMRAHGIPLGELDGGACRVLVLNGQELAETVRALTGDPKYEVRVAANGFEAGVVAQQFRPHVIVLWIQRRQEEEAVAICRNIKSNNELAGTKVIAAIATQATREAAWFEARGFDDCLIGPFTAAELMNAVQKSTNLIS